MERKRKLSEAIKKNDQATRKKTARVHNQAWDALDLATLAKIFDLLPSQELFWNVSLVCPVWQLACWDKLFWNRYGCLDLTAAKPFHCCRVDDKRTSSIPKEYHNGFFPFSFGEKEYHNHTCSELMMHLLQTILFGTHDAYGNSLEEWRSSIKTIRIPIEVKICNDLFSSLSCPELVHVEPAAERSRPLVLPGVVSSWNVKRLLLESPLFRKPIFTHSVDVDDWKVFTYILRSTFKSSSADLMAFHRSLPDNVMEQCRIISQDLKDMVEKLTNCGILPEVLTEDEHRRLYQARKVKKFCDDESLKLACEQDSCREIHEFWLAVEDLFSDDKKNLSSPWRTCRGRSAFLDHYYALKIAEPGCGCYTPTILKGSAVREWRELRVREGVSKVPTKVVLQGTNIEQQDKTTGQLDPLQADAEKQTKRQDSTREVPEIRKFFFSYAKYQEIAKGRREFLKKLMKMQLPTATYEEFGVPPETEQEVLKQIAEALHLRECAKLLKLWGGGPYKNILRKGVD